MGFLADFFFPPTEDYPFFRYFFKREDISAL